MGKGRRLQSVQAAEKTLELLGILVMGSERLTIGRLATKLGLGRNDTLLLLVTLESRGVVRWDEQAKVYRPGQESVELARQLLGLVGLPLVEPKTTVVSRPLTARPVVTRNLRSGRRLEAGVHATTHPDDVAM